MTSSLQQGINAAKAGRMQEALSFLKDAIIEEPQNADVWVWIAAIIDDLDKQKIFLERALGIDPNNIPAQRGLVYLEKRLNDAADVQHDHLSEHTQPISPFPNSEKTLKTAMNNGWSRLGEDDWREIMTKTQREATSEVILNDQDKNKPKLSLLELVLLGVVVFVFFVIGLLASSAVFDFNLPLGFIMGNRPRLRTDPPYPGVFLYENSYFFDIQKHEGLPSTEVGMPTSLVEDPVIIFWETDANPDQMKLIYQTGEYINFRVYGGKTDAVLIKAESVLQSGLYCFQYLPNPQAHEEAYFWCFSVQASD